MVNAKKLNIFVESVVSFFAQAGETLEDIDTPFLNDNTNVIAMDYSGIISISGPFEGCVYVSAPSSMLRQLLSVLGESESSISIMKDLLGEIANTVAGNARTEYGAEFIISPPKVVDGAPSSTFLPKSKRTYVIPFHWRGSSALIGICLNTMI